jgi:hypothetical protein
MKQTLNKLSTYFKKDVVKNEVKTIDTLLLKETVKPKSVANLTKEYFDAGHI